MKKHNLAFIDIEMTGLDVFLHEIIEIGCVVADSKLKILEEFEIKVKPEHIESADEIALRVNHYLEKDWENAVPLKEALKKFLEKTKDCIMVGHNVAFDSVFLEHNLSKLKIKNTMHYHKLDTISIAWAKLHRDKKIEHFSLREFCKHFKIRNKNPHSALSDARATYLLYKKLIKLK